MKKRMKAEKDPDLIGIRGNVYVLRNPESVENDRLLFLLHDRRAERGLLDCEPSSALRQR
jgi:hypothetical protein